MRVVRRDLLGKGNPATGERPEGVLGRRGRRVQGTWSESGTAREERVVGEGLQGFSQRGRCGHEDLFQGDHRRGTGLHGRVTCDLELAQHLDGAIGRLGDRCRLAREH